MTVKAIMPERVLNPVRPLGQGVQPEPTAMRITETGAHQGVLWSDAVVQPIGASLGPGDVDSLSQRRTPRTTPSFRTSRTATRTGTTRTTSTGFAPSADSSPATSQAQGGAPFTMPDLVQAWLDCRRSKRNSASALEFEQHLERNL